MDLLFDISHESLIYNIAPRKFITELKTKKIKTIKFTKLRFGMVIRVSLSSFAPLSIECQKKNVDWTSAIVNPL